MKNDKKNSKKEDNKKEDDKRYDLEERTAKFSENIIKFAKKVPKNVITIPLITQLIKAGTSVGANPGLLNKRLL